ncbi:MAG: response regulator [Phycisphaeraceae bacterium]|nr:response regulator [Phycisphaeraceae bacterium]
MKILLVDDSKTMRHIQRSILSKTGFHEIEEACDGQDALAKIDGFCPDLLVVDWSMPTMDGLVFAEEYRGQGGTAPIIMVMSEAEKRHVSEVLKAGIENYVIKPFTPDIMSRRIRETLDRSPAA